MTFRLSTSAITSDGTATSVTFDTQEGLYELGYIGVLGGASFTMQFRNGSTDEWKDATSVGTVSSTNTSVDVYPQRGQDYRVVTTGSGGSTSFTPIMTRKGF